MVPRVLLVLSLCIVSEVFGQYGSFSGYTRQRYPNPMEESHLCGREFVDKSYVCDPDHILGSQKKEVSQLDRIIASIINETSCPCSAYSCERHREGYKVGIALIHKMEFDEDNRHVNDDIDEGEAKKSRIVRNLHQAQLYAYEIQKKWKLGRCDEDVIIFYSREDNVVYTATGDVARKKLTNEFVASVARDARYNGFLKSPFDGLLQILNDYRSVFLNSYHRRKPVTGEQKSGNFGMTSKKSQVLTILTSVLFILCLLG